MNKTEDAAFDLLEHMANNNEGGGSERTILRRQAPNHDSEAIRALTEQVAMLTRQLQGAPLGVNSIATCQWCQGPHPSESCQAGNPMTRETPEQANFVGNAQFGNTYNPNWRNHPNFSWKNQAAAVPMPQAQPKEARPDLEELMAKMAKNTTDFMVETRSALQQQSVQIRNLEMQIGRLVLAQNSRPQGTLPSNTEVNPKEQCNAIVLRSGKKLEERSEPEPARPHKNEEPAVEKESEKVATEQVAVTSPLPCVPFLQRLEQGKLDKQFVSFGCV